jgi:hypothetical protein
MYNTTENSLSLILGICIVPANKTEEDMSGKTNRMERATSMRHMKNSLQGAVGVVKLY